MTDAQKSQAKKLRSEGMEYGEIGKQIGASYDQVRGYLRYAPPEIQKPAPKEPSPLLQDLKKYPLLSELCKRQQCTERVLRAHLDDLADNGYLITVDGDSVRLETSLVVQKSVPCDWNGEKIIRFAVTSDLHLCSKYQQITMLDKFYDLCEREGIDTVYDSGDMSEGYHMRRGHEHDVFKHGADDQAQYIIQNHPRRKGIKKKFILGNHDYSHVINGGHDIGAVIAAGRDDMEYLGMLNAVVPLTPNCLMELNHPLDGASYATSYSIQKYIDSMSGGEKPNILINGHHHKALYGFYRNIHYLEAGTFEMQSGWMKGKRIAAHVGGWIVEIRVDDEGKVSRFKPEWVPYYVFKHNDY